MSKSILFMFSSRNFIVSDLKSKFLIHFEFIAYMVWKLIQFFFLHVAVKFSQYYLLKRAFSTLYIFCFLCHRVIGHIYVDFFPVLFILLSWSMCLSLWQYYSVLVSIGLYYSLKSDSMMPPALFFLPKIVLPIWVLLCFYSNSRIICSSSVIYTFGTFMGIAMNL